MRITLALCLFAFSAGCTIDVGVPQPNITLDCVEVVFPGEQVRDCRDAGGAPPRDAGGDRADH